MVFLHEQPVTPLHAKQDNEQPCKLHIQQLPSALMTAVKGYDGTATESTQGK